MDVEVVVLVVGFVTLIVVVLFLALECLEGVVERPAWGEFGCLELHLSGFGFERKIIYNYYSVLKRTEYSAKN